MARITVTVKFMNGDLIEIHHKPSRGFDDFVRTIYRLYTDIPYGCLVLKRALYEEDDEVAQLMLLPDIYSDYVLDPCIVTEVYDGDEIFAIIDPSLVLPYIIRDVNVAIPSSNPKFQHFVSVYSINFRSKHDNHESQTVVFHDTDSNTFALCDTFHPPTPQEASDYHYHGQVEVYKPTSQTVWFHTLYECLLSSMDRFPHDDNTLQIIQHSFDAEEWEWEDGIDVDWRAEDDDGFEEYQANEADHDFRWAHLIDN
jgi:hypothetical protein